MKNFKDEKTFVMIKPDGIQRSLVGEIIKRYERSGLKIVAFKMLVPTHDQIEKHYTIDPEWKRKVGEKAMKAYEKNGQKHPAGDDPVKVGDSVITRLKKYMSSGPAIAMVLQGAHAVEVVRKLTGSTEPLSSDVGTIRGDFVLDSYPMSDADDRAVRNLLHASTSTDEAEKEIAIWFKQEEIIKYRHIQEAIIYAPTIEGILE